jgi:hypothetical protein
LPLTNYIPSSLCSLPRLHVTTIQLALSVWISPSAQPSPPGTTDHSLPLEIVVEAEGGEEGGGGGGGERREKTKRERERD